VQVGKIDPQTREMILTQGSLRFPDGTNQSRNYRADLRCESDQYVKISGATRTCELCQAGHIPTSARDACQECPVGRSTPDRRNCFDCDPGRYSATAGQSICASCQEGKFSNSTRSSKCQECKPGRYQAYMGKSYCETFEAGKFSSSPAVTECQNCAQTYYQPTPGSVSCLPCGTDKTTRGDGMAKLEECICIAKMYMASGTTFCKACPDGMSCKAGSREDAIPRSKAEVLNASKRTYPKVQPGFWTTYSQPLETYLCSERNQIHCPGGAPETCKKHRTGLVCGVCAKTHVDISGACLRCALWEKNMIVFPMVPVILAPLVILYMHSSSSSEVSAWGNPKNAIMTVSSLLLIYVQTLDKLQKCAYTTPPEMKSSWAAWDFSTDLLALFRPRCAVLGNGFQINFTIRMFIPVYVALIFVTTFFIANYVGKISTRPAARAVLTIDGNVLFSCYGTVIYSFYIAVVSQSISLFQVYSHPNGKRSLVAYPQVIFGDSQWMAVLPVGIMGILLFCVGFMCTFTYIVIVAPFCFNIEAFRKRWRFLFLKFHPRVWWWTLIVLLKALLVNLATVFFSAGVLQVWWLALMCLIYGNACFTCLPWRFFSANIADLALHMILVFIAALSTHFADQKNWSEGQISRLVIGVSFIPFLLYVAICLVQLQKLRSPSSPEDFE